MVYVQLTSFGYIKLHPPKFTFSLLKIQNAKTKPSELKKMRKFRFKPKNPGTEFNT